jgi:hypothetical protein
MPQVARTARKRSQAVPTAPDRYRLAAWIRTGALALAGGVQAQAEPLARSARPVTAAQPPGSRWPAGPLRARSTLARVIPAASSQVASGPPVTLGPGSPADGPEHGPPLTRHGQPAAPAFRGSRPAQPLHSSR